MLKQIKSYRKNVTVVTDGEKYYSFTDSDWNGEFFHATEENEDNQIIKNSFADIVPIIDWHNTNDIGDCVGYDFGRQTINLNFKEE